jgi:glutamyl-tRNA synthetase
MPTYQFASVVDDHLMEISHVTRADEWLPSFPKNYLLYQAFGWQAPKFIHLPVVLNKTGGKLSKRHGDVAVEDYRDKGYLPEAIVNFCSLLGWHPKGDNEIFSLADSAKEFDYKKINTSPAVFDLEKLDFFNGYYIRKLSDEKYFKIGRPYLESFLETNGIDPGEFNDIFKNKVMKLEQERIKKLSEIGEMTKFFFVYDLQYDKELLLWKKLTFEDVKKNLEKIHELLEKIPESHWTNDSIEECLVSYLKSKELKAGDYLWPMRVALTGLKASPGPFDTAEILGKKSTISRITKAMQMI